MGHLFGIVSFNNKKIKQETLSKMQDSIPCFAPDIKNLLLHQNVGLGILHRTVTKEDKYEKVPREIKSNKLFSFTGRIDNREELIESLRIKLSKDVVITDSYIVEVAYNRWGENCSDKLLGDWSLVIWDIEKESLFIARDHFGHSPIFYATYNDFFVFSSHRTAIHSIGVPRRLNELHLAQVLVSWAEYHNERTIDVDIFRLPPAHAMKVSKNKVKKWRYWKLEETPKLKLHSFEEYVEGFMEIYKEAINCRLRASTPISTTLSGGLDSSSVTLLAAQILQKTGKKINAYTAAPLYNISKTVPENRFGDETRFAELCANQFSNINHKILLTKNISPLDGVKQSLAYLNNPGHAGSNMYWIIDILESVQLQNSRVLLTGQAGNATVSWSGISKQKLLLYNSKFFIKKHLPFFRYIAGKNQNYFSSSSINLSFATRLNLKKRKEESLLDREYLSSSILRYNLIKPEGSIIGDIWHNLGNALGVEVRDPTTDKRLMAYSLSIPNRFFFTKGDNKRIIKAAIKGLLPDEVRLAKKKGMQAADLTERIARSQGEFIATMSLMKNGLASEYIDFKKMEETLFDIIKNKSPRNNHLASTILMRGIEAAIFLTNYSGGTPK